MKGCHDWVVPKMLFHSSHLAALPGRALPPRAPHGLDKGRDCGRGWAVGQWHGQGKQAGRKLMSSPLFLFPFPQTHQHTEAMAETPATATSTASLGGIRQLVGHKNFVRHNPMSDRFEVGKEGGRKGRKGGGDGLPTQWHHTQILSSAC